MTLKSINPSTGILIKKYNTNTKEEISAKLEIAESTFNHWKTTGIDKRASLLSECAKQLEANKIELAQIIHKEMGKVLPEAVAEIEKCVWVCNYYAEFGPSFLQAQSLPIDNKVVEVLFQPLGAILAIMPWNFPFWQVFRFAAPSILAGNVGVLKHASNVSGCALAIENIFRKAGAKEGVFQSLLLSTDQVQDVISNPVIKAVTLTGSEKAGSSVASLAGRYIKKTVLELGGSDPFIVLEDAEIELAVDSGIISRMRNAGQSCIAAKRFIVIESIHDRFVDEFKKGTEQLIRDVDYGPMARVDLAEELENQVKTSIAHGAQLICGGNRDHAYFEPSILINVNKGMPAYQEELFGPVASVIKVNNIEEAISVANDTNFGLGASIWTRNKANANNIAHRLDAGAIFINQMVASDPRIPFGGIKKSGYGRELGLWGIREFVNVKPIVS